MKKRLAFPSFLFLLVGLFAFSPSPVVQAQIPTNTPSSYSGWAIVADDGLFQSHSSGNSAIPSIVAGTDGGSYVQSAVSSALQVDFVLAYPVLATSGTINLESNATGTQSSRVATIRYYNGASLVYTHSVPSFAWTGGAGGGSWGAGVMGTGSGGFYFTRVNVQLQYGCGGCMVRLKDITLNFTWSAATPTATSMPSNTPTETYTPSITPTATSTFISGATATPAPPALETWCYDFNFANSSFSSTFSSLGNYEVDLETDEGYWTTEESGGIHKIALSYNPYWGIGFFGRMTKATLNIHYPVDSVSNYPAINLWGYGLRVGWESIQDDFFSLVGYENLTYTDFNQPVPSGSSYTGNFYAEVSNPYSFQNGLTLEISNNVSGTQLYSARFEGTGSSPFGSSNCESTSPAPEIIATNQPPPSPTPSPSPTPTGMGGTPTLEQFTFDVVSNTCIIDPDTGVSFYIVINQGVETGNGIISSPHILDYTIFISETIDLSALGMLTKSGSNSGLTRRSWRATVYNNDSLMLVRSRGFPYVWSGAADMAGSEGALGMFLGGANAAGLVDELQIYMNADSDTVGSVTSRTISIEYFWSDGWDTGDTPCPEPVETPSPTPTITNTPIATLTPFPTSTATPSTDGQCLFTNSSFTNGISPWTSSGTIIPGAINLTTGQSIEQTLTLDAATYQLSLMVSSSNDGSGAGTASFAYTASLGSLSGSLGSFSLAEFQSSANQRIYTASFSSAAGSSTITITPTLTGSITSVQVLSVCLFLSMTDDGSDDSGSGGVFTYQCGEALTPPPLSILAIGEWIIFLAKALLQWFNCVLLPLLQNFFNMVNNFWQYMRDFGFFFYNWLNVFFTWLSRDFVNWLKGLLASFLNLLLDIIAGFQGIANPLGSIFSRLFNIFGLLLSRLYMWLSVVSLSVSVILAAWDASGANVIGVNLHNCVTSPLESDICAFFYIAENTILAGAVGSLIIPLITAILYTISLLYIVDLVTRFIKDIREGSK